MTKFIILSAVTVSLLLGLSNPVLCDSELSLGEVEFAVDLFQSVYNLNPDRNILISPFSVYRTLILAYLAADGETNAKLSNILRLKWAQGSKDKVFKAFLSDIEPIASHSQEGLAEISVADRIFIDNRTIVL